MTTLLAGAGSSTDSYEDDVFQFEDVVNSSTYLQNTIYQKPDTVFVNPIQYADIVKDERFRDYSKSNTLAPLREGTIGGQIAGLNVVTLPEIPDRTVMVAAMDKKPLWLVVLQDMKTEAFRIPDERTDKVQMWVYEKPAVLRPEALRKITITEA
jgi:hypothetical protein